MVWQRQAFRPLLGFTDKMFLDLLVVIEYVQPIQNTKLSVTQACGGDIATYKMGSHLRGSLGANL